MHRGGSVSKGMTSILPASSDSPRNITPGPSPSDEGLRAFFHSGFLKAGTPLEIASTPVTAAPPEAKAQDEDVHRGPDDPGAGLVHEAAPCRARRRGRARRSQARAEQHAMFDA